MKILTEPLTKNQIEQYKDDANYISGIVRVELEELIENYLESVLDILSERLTGTDLLMDITYKVVGNRENTLYLKVYGDVSSVLEFI